MYFQKGQYIYIYFNILMYFQKNIAIFNVFSDCESIVTVKIKA